jgi:sodium/bile acid cotransporter 7
MKNKVKEFFSNIGIDGFALALVGVIVLAYLWPSGGIDHPHFSLTAIANVGLSFIFFFYGLKLNREKLKAGLSNWKLHLIVQASTFILFPLLIFPWRMLMTSEHLALIWLGVFFLASLPSTVSSSVVMVSIAEGNIPAAIFNASVSSLAGIFITPLWMGLVLTGTSQGIDIENIIGKLLLQVLLPVILGFGLNRYWGKYADRYKKELKYFDQAIILTIVYTSFCESFEKKMFSGFGMGELFLLGCAMIVLFFVAYGIIQVVTRWLGFTPPDRITATFCGSKKSIIHGTVMSRVLFPGNPYTGILLLPLMMYHALQIIIVSVLAKRLAKHHTTAK